MKRLSITLIGLLTLMSCSSVKHTSSVDHMLQSTVWMQNAGEYKALCYQAYNIAKIRLERALRVKSSKPYAVVLDLDETVLDNSPYTAKNIIEDRVYTEDNWGEWLKESKARPIPGALEFLNYAHKKGVDLIYISNRKTAFHEATYKNMLAYGIPVKSENIHLKTTTSSKEKRRIEILKKYNVALYLGDALGDFHKDFEKRSMNERNFLSEKKRRKFGRKYIVFPNPTYGEWQESIFNYDHSKSLEKKRGEFTEHLYPF